MKEKVIPTIKVSEMPFYDGVINKREKNKWGAICSTGKVNAYRLAFLQGRGGSRKEETWNKKKHLHTCCKSAVPWRHLRNCPRLYL